MTVRDLERAELVIFAVRQAGPRASLEEMKAICYCIRNRVRAGWHDGSWLRCLEDQPEVAAHSPVEEVPLDPNDRNLQRLLRDIDDIYYSQNDAKASSMNDGMDLEAAVGTQKYWMFLNHPLTNWFRDNICSDKENHPSHSQMGLMMFFE